jgi:hypothetical protein
MARNENAMTERETMLLHGRPKVRRFGSLMRIDEEKWSSTSSSFSNNSNNNINVNNNNNNKVLFTTSNSMRVDGMNDNDNNNEATTTTTTTTTTKTSTTTTTNTTTTPGSDQKQPDPDHPSPFSLQNLVHTPSKERKNQPSTILEEMDHRSNSNSNCNSNSNSSSEELKRECQALEAIILQMRKEGHVTKRKTALTMSTYQTIIDDMTKERDFLQKHCLDLQEKLVDLRRQHIRRLQQRQDVVEDCDHLVEERTT